jgi:hypothetical protein
MREDSLYPSIPNLPALLPGETIYSWCGTVHAWNGNTDVRKTSRQLFGAPYAGLLHDFPSHLAALDKRTAQSLGDTRRLGQTNTLLGYFLPFLAADVAGHILEALQSGTIPHLKMSLGITASRVGAYHPLKGCVDCFNDDEAAYGRAYWHVTHQYPSSLVCIKHGQPLKIAHSEITPVHRRVWLRPRHWLAHEWIDVAVETDAQMASLTRIAEFSALMAEMPPASLRPSVLSATYQAELGRHGAVTSGGNLRLNKLVDTIRTSYRGMEKLPGFEVLKSVNADWPGLAAALSRKIPRPGHPLKHLLLIAMLFDRWCDFIDAYERSAMELSAVEPESSPGEDAAEDLRLLDFKSLVIESGLSISAASMKVGVTTATGVRWATANGISFTARPKTLTPTLLNRVRRLLRAGHAKTEIQRRTGITAVSLNRLISSEPEAAEAWRSACFQKDLDLNRQRFLKVVGRHPGWPVKSLRQIPGNGYMWLYRNDRQWLVDHLPSLWLD